MSSAIRAHGVISQTTKFQKVTTPCYYDNTAGTTVPIPFSYHSNTLDINIQDNVQSDLIDDGDSPNYDTEYQCKSTGGTGLVLSIGSSMRTWLENWLSNAFEGATITNVAVHTPAQVTRAQFFLENNTYSGTFLEADVDDSTYAITENPPSGTEYVTGDEQNNYGSVWIFKTPLSIGFKAGGTQYYVSLFTNFAPNYVFD